MLWPKDDIENTKRGGSFDTQPPLNKKRTGLTIKTSKGGSNQKRNDPGGRKSICSQSRKKLPEMTEEERMKLIRFGLPKNEKKQITRAQIIKKLLKKYKPLINITKERRLIMKSIETAQMDEEDYFRKLLGQDTNSHRLETENQTEVDQPGADDQIEESLRTPTVTNY